MKSRPTLLLLAILVLGLGLGACSTEHGDLIDELPDLPRITKAQVVGDPADEVLLEWEYGNDESVDEYKVYYGIYLSFGQTSLDLDTLVTTTSEQSYSFQDPTLGTVDENFCSVGFCDTLYTYSYFRVSAVIDGEEQSPGWRSFPRR